MKDYMPLLIIGLIVILISQKKNGKVVEEKKSDAEKY
jgi:hypothetical protein